MMSEQHMGQVGHVGHGEAASIDEKAILTYEGWFSIHATYKINFENGKLGIQNVKLKP